MYYCLQKFVHLVKIQQGAGALVVLPGLPLHLQQVEPQIHLMFHLDSYQNLMIRDIDRQSPSHAVQRLELWFLLLVPLPVVHFGAEQVPIQYHSTTIFHLVKELIQS